MGEGQDTGVRRRSGGAAVERTLPSCRTHGRGYGTPTVEAGDHGSPDGGGGLAEVLSSP